MSELMPDPVWFGPVEGGLDDARARFAAAGAPLERARAAIELCKHGDFSRAGALADQILDLDDGDAVDAQLALLSVATDGMLADPATTDYLWRSTTPVIFQFAGSGETMLGRHAVPLLVAVLEQVGDIADIGEHAFSSLDALLGFEGSGISEWNASPRDIEAYAEEVLARAEGAYLIEGRPFDAVALARRMLERARRAVGEGRPWSNLASASPLSIWSGLRCPELAYGPHGEADLALLEAYVERFAALPWPPGAKCFYGRPVDGDPSPRPGGST